MKKIFYCIVVITFFSPSIKLVAQERKWTPFYTSSDGYVNYYDSSTVKLKSRVIRSVWIKKQPLPDSLHSVRQTEYIITRDANYLRYSYTVCKMEVDCADERIRVITIADYDENEKPLQNFELKDEDIQWQNAIPQTLGDALVNAMCR
jgi:hypothetical protein